MRKQTLGEELIEGLTELRDAVERGEPLRYSFAVRDVPKPRKKGTTMKKGMIMLAIGMCACLCSGCTNSLDMGRIHWKVASIPQGVWSWEVIVPGYSSVSSLDAVQLADAVGELITHIIGMVPFL